MTKKLELYRKKRNFKATPEPKAKIKKSKNGTIFVVQQHHASHMHFDFRIEMDGVLKSWAVPKGPSLNPKEKRLAELTEDHPLDYATFEGIIPKGYGKGTVIVWDKGTYKNLNEKDDEEISMQTAFRNGHLKFALKGKKLKGEFALVHTKFKSDNDWLLIKMNDEYANTKNVTKSEPESVLSKKTIAQLDEKFKETQEKD